MQLFFFTNSYPYGYGEKWKTDELIILKDYFEKVTVVPYCDGGKEIDIAMINSINYIAPLFKKKLPEISHKKKILKIIFSFDIFTFLNEFFSERIFLSKKKFYKWLNSSYKMICIKKSESFRQILKTATPETIFYFFWGREISEVIPVLKNKSQKLISRFHGYDLYKERNDGYIPYQRKLIKHLEYALTCSDDGQKVLKNYYPHFASKIITKRLGTISQGRSGFSEDGSLVIISCSFVNKLKRNYLIAESLKYVTKKIHWIHIGDGDLLPDLKNRVKETKENVKVSLLGKMTNDAVIKFYCENNIDLFINVSEYEGVPVSIMEALGAGIPILATNVGGVSEIVDDTVGKLITKDTTALSLAQEIDKFAELPFETKKKIRDAAFIRYEEKCNAVKLTHELGFFLNHLV